MGAAEDQAARYAAMFGVSPEYVPGLARVLGPAPAAPAAPAGPTGPAPGDAGFAASVLGAPSAAAPPPSARPSGPAPGDAGFTFANVPNASASAPAPAPGQPVLKNIPKGAGQIDTSEVIPKGFGSGAITLKNVPKGAGQIDFSGITPPKTAMDEAGAEVARNGGAAASTGHFVGGQWVPTGRSEARREGFNPDELREGAYRRDVAAGQRLLSGDKQLEAAQQQARADVAYAQSHMEATQEAKAQMAQLQQQKTAYIQDEQQKLANLSHAAQQQVDPEAAKGSAGAQLLATIAVAMGQFGASINGGPNTALQIVQGNIDRRIRAQEANIANAGKAHDRETNLYKQNLEAFGDRERAVLATKVQLLDQAKALADKQYAEAKGISNEGQYHAFVAGIQDERGKAADDFAKLTHTQVETQGSEHYAPPHMEGGPVASHEAKADAKWYADKLGEKGIPGRLAELQDAEKAIDTIGSGDIPGVGLGADFAFGISPRVGKAIYGDAASATRQTIAGIKNRIAHEIAGASKTPAEKEDLDKQLEGAHDAASLRRVVGTLRSRLHQEAGNYGGGITAEGKAAYKSQGGTVDPNIRLDRSTTPTLRPVEDK